MVLPPEQPQNLTEFIPVNGTSNKNKSSRCLLGPASLNEPWMIITREDFLLNKAGARTSAKIGIGNNIVTWLCPAHRPFIRSNLSTSQTAQDLIRFININQQHCAPTTIWHGEFQIAMRVFFLALLTWLSFVFAEPYGPDEFCYRACEIVIGTAQFHSINHDADWRKESCTNELKLTSGFLCLRIFCTPEEIVDRLLEFNETCRHVDSPLPPYSIINGYTDEDIDHLHHLTPEEISETPAITFNEVVVPSKQLYGLAYRTLVRFLSTWLMLGAENYRMSLILRRLSGYTTGKKYPCYVKNVLSTALKLS